MNKNIFQLRDSIKPYEYPELLLFKDAIRHSYWLHSEFNFTTDIQNFHIDVSDIERDIIKKTILAISTIELKVKRFWGDIYKRLPKSEIDAVGATFAENEIRHMDAYSHLLEILGLNNEFENINQVEAIKGREDYLKKYLSGARVKDDRIFTKTILLFSLFIEHVSLFSQFLIMLSFNKERNIFKDISNVVEATSVEENIHGLFGIKLINIIKNENPQWFDDDMENIIMGGCKKAFEAEVKILDWIFEKGELDFLPKNQIIEFIKNRFNMSLRDIGYNDYFIIDEILLEPLDWFDLKLTAPREDDFFYKRSTSYNKKSFSITEDDLF